MHATSVGMMIVYTLLGPARQGPHKTLSDRGLRPFWGISGDPEVAKKRRSLGGEKCEALCNSGVENVKFPVHSTGTS